MTRYSKYAVANMMHIWGYIVDYDLALADISPHYYKPMLTNDHKKQIKLYFLNEASLWQQYAQAVLHLEIIGTSCSLRLALRRPLLPADLAILPQPHLFNPIDNTLHIEMDLIDKIEKMDQLVIALEIRNWPRVLGLSFKDELYCDIILQQLELNTTAKSKLPCKEDELIEYIAAQVELNPLFIEMFLNCDEIIEAFMRQARRYEHLPDSPHKRTVFRTIKQLFLRADPNIIKLLLQDRYYPQLLLCLSYNYQFGDRTIAYHQEYQRTLAVTNLLDIADQTILQKYTQNIKIRYLIHVAASMFIEPLAESVLLQMLNYNSLALLQFFVRNPQTLSKANKLGQKYPDIFLLLFSQLWQTFKSIMQDVRSASIKRSFKDLFISENMLNVSFQSVLALSQQENCNTRIYQQFLQALNPCLSHKWNQSQELLLFLYEQKRTHILQLLLVILKVADYNTKVIVLLFAKNLVEVTENRPKMKQAFFNYFFNEFVSKFTQELQILVDFFMKLYKMDLVRTRRAIIESDLLKKLQEKMNNKYVLIVVLKLLRYFLEFANDGIFGYMNRHKLFQNLRQRYFSVKKYWPNGITNSLFVGLLKDLLKTQNSAGLKYLHKIMCAQKNNI